MFMYMHMFMYMYMAWGPSAIQVHRRPALGYYVTSAVGKPVSKPHYTLDMALLKR